MTAVAHSDIALDRSDATSAEFDATFAAQAPFANWRPRPRQRAAPPSHAEAGP